MSGLEQVNAEIAETKGKIVQAESDGRSEAYLTSLQNNLAALRHKENLLMAAGSGNVIIA